MWTQSQKWLDSYKRDYINVFTMYRLVQLLQPGWHMEQILALDYLEMSYPSSYRDNTTHLSISELAAMLNKIRNWTKLLDKQ